MASNNLSSAVPHLWRAQLEADFDAATVWGQLCRDFSSEFNNGGDRVNLNELTTVPTVRDYTIGEDMADAEEATTTAVVLQLDKQKYWRVAMDDIDQIQTRPALMQELTRKASVQAAQQFDTDVRTEYAGGTWDDEGEGQNSFEVTVAATPTAENRQALVNQVQDIVELQDVDSFPTGRWMVIPPVIRKQLVRFLVQDKGTLGSGQLQDSALVDNRLRDLFGLTVVTDTNMTNSVAAGSVLAYFGINSWGCYGRQIRKIESSRHPDQFADVVRGLYVYGIKRVHDDRRFRIVAA